MTCNPRVSVVIIFLNEEKFLRQAIDSVLACSPIWRSCTAAIRAVWCGSFLCWCACRYSCRPRAWSATLLGKPGVTSFTYDISEQRPGSLALRGRAAG